MKNDDLGQIYNIETEDVSMSELVNLIMKLSNIKLDIKFDKSTEGRFVKSSQSALLKSIVDENKLNLLKLELIIKMFDWYNYSLIKNLQNENTLSF